MAELFQASLLDQNGNVGIVRNGDNIIIKDYSNYLTNTENFCASAQFDTYKKIKITSYTGKEYLFSSLGDGDALISVPTDEFPNFPLEKTFDWKTNLEAGIITVKLAVIPYNSDAVPTGSYTVFGGNVFLALTETSDNPLSAPTEYTDLGIQEAFDIDTLPSQYTSEVRFFINNISNSLFTQSAKVLGCEILNGTNQCSDICNNVNIQNMIKNCLTAHAQTLFDNDEDAMANVINDYNITLNKCKC